MLGRIALGALLRQLSCRSSVGLPPAKRLLGQRCLTPLRGSDRGATGSSAGAQAAVAAGQLARARGFKKRSNAIRTSQMQLALFCRRAFWLSGPWAPSQLRDSAGLAPAFPRYFRWLLPIGTGKVASNPITRDRHRAHCSERPPCQSAWGKDSDCAAVSASGGLRFGRGDHAVDALLASTTLQQESPIQISD